MKDKKVDAYIAKQKSPQQEICVELRALIFQTLPTVIEEMQWGVPSYNNGNYYIVALKTHVNLGFSIENLSEDEIALLQGTGKTMRTLEIKSVKEIDKKLIERLLKLVNKNS